MTSDKTFLGAAAALCVLFLASLAFYLLLPGALTRTVLRFPQEISKALVPEVRSLPFNWDREHNVELLVREVLLGPARHDHLRLFSRQAGLRSVLVREGNIYIDLTKGSFIPDADVIYSPVTALDVLKATLMDNFAGIGSVWISVEGEPSRVIVVDKG
jgi:hypothetical protein